MNLKNVFGAILLTSLMVPIYAQNIYFNKDAPVASYAPTTNLDGMDLIMTGRSGSPNFHRESGYLEFDIDSCDYPITSQLTPKAEKLTYDFMKITSVDTLDNGADQFCHLN